MEGRLYLHWKIAFIQKTNTPKISGNKVYFLLWELRVRSMSKNPPVIRDSSQTTPGVQKSYDLDLEGLCSTGPSHNTTNMLINWGVASPIGPWSFLFSWEKSEQWKWTVIPESFFKKSDSLDSGNIHWLQIIVFIYLIEVESAQNTLRRIEPDEQK